MLTLDDLDHFDERTVAGLLDPAATVREHASTAMRRERILACLRFCRDIPSSQLPGDGMLTARRLLRRALRSQRRERRLSPEEMADFLEGALEALGDRQHQPDEAVEAAALRHAVEREMQASARARSWTGTGTAQPALLEILARGDFDIGPGSCVAPLEEAISRFGGSAEVEIQLLLEGGHADIRPLVRLCLRLSCGLWRWSALPGCSVTFDGEEAMPLAVDDELLPVILAGLSVQNGRAITQWSAAVQVQSPAGLN